MSATIRKILVDS